MRYLHRYLILLPLLLVLAACTNAPAPEPTPTPDVSTSGPQPTSQIPPDDALVGDWIVISVGNAPVQTEVIPTLTFEQAGNVVGEGGCNGFGGTYSTDGNALTIAGVTATLMACEDDAINTQESAYLEALTATTAYILDGDSLTLTNESGEALVVLRRDAP